MKPSIIVLLAVCLLTTPRLIHAQVTRDEARALFIEGNELFAKGEFKAALERYRKASELYPSYKIDLNIAATLARLGRNAEALRNYEKFLRTADKVSPAETVETTRREVERIRPLVAVLRVDGEPRGATVYVDGEPLAKVPTETDLFLEPGVHVVGVFSAKFLPLIKKLDLRAGERKVLPVDLDPDPAFKEEDKPPPLPKPEPPPPPPRRNIEIAGAEIALGAGFGWSTGSEAVCSDCLYSRSDSGFLGMGVVVRLVTLKWKYLFWTALDTGFMAGKANSRFAMIATRLGLQFHPGQSGRLRLQVGLGMGYYYLSIPSAYQTDPDNYDRTSNEFTLNGFMFSPTLHMDYRVGENLTLGGGIRLPISAGYDLSSSHMREDKIERADEISPAMFIFGFSVGWSI